MLLLLCSINLFGQIQTPIDSLVTIDIRTIRKANEKLIKVDYFEKIVIEQTDIISDYKLLSEKQDSIIYKYQIKNIALEQELESANIKNEKLNKSINTKNKIIAFTSGTSFISILALVLSLLI